MMRRAALVLAAMGLSLMASTGVAVAAGDPSPDPLLEQCQPDPAHYGELPSCTYDGNGNLIDKSYDSGSGGSGPGIPGIFIGLMVIGGLVSLGLVVWRVTLARDLATRAGLDSGDATAVTLLSRDGLDATYLAAALGKRDAPNTVQLDEPGHVQAELSGSGPQSPSVAGGRTTEERLRELAQLKERGLVTAEEFESRRKAILDAI